MSHAFTAETIAATPFRLPMVVSLIIHGIVLSAIGFAVLTSPPAIEQDQLLITLVNAASESEPEDAEVLAQANADGGGTVDEKRVATTITPGQTLPTVSDPGVTQAPQTSAREERRIRSDQLLALESPQSDLISSSRLGESAELADSEREHRDFSNEISRLSATLDRQIQRYAERPRHTFLSARTREYEYATYMKQWVEKVERVGNANLPSRIVTQGISGELVLDVAINREGKVVERRVSRSSGQAWLDDLALKIVELSEPYPPLSSEILNDTDILHIVRTWRFSADGTWRDVTP